MSDVSIDQVIYAAINARENEFIDLLRLYARKYSICQRIIGPCVQYGTLKMFNKMTKYTSMNSTIIYTIIYYDRDDIFNSNYNTTWWPNDTLDYAIACNSVKIFKRLMIKGYVITEPMINTGLRHESVDVLIQMHLPVDLGS